jgi:hypothetical protein
MAITANTGGTINNATAGTSLVFGSFTGVAQSMIVVGVAILTTTVSISSVTDTSGNVWVLKSAINSGTTVRVELWETTLSRNGSPVVTVNFSGSTLASAALEQYVGPVFTAPYSTTNIIPTMTSNTAPSGTASASTTWSTVFPWDAFAPAQSGWITNAVTTGWLQYQFPSAQTVLAYSIIPWSADTFPTRSPSAWTFQGSNDGSTWTTLDTRSNYTNAWVQNAAVYFTVPTSGSYLYYRLNITANGGDTYVGIHNLAMMTTAPAALTQNTSTAVGTGFYPEADLATQDSTNWIVTAVATASTSGDTFTAYEGTIRRSLVPALTTASIALIDNTCVIQSPIMRGGVQNSASRVWAAASLELRTGAAAMSVVKSNNGPIITRATSTGGGSGGSYTSIS